VAPFGITNKNSVQRLVEHSSRKSYNSQLFVAHILSGSIGYIRTLCYVR